MSYLHPRSFGKINFKALRIFFEVSNYTQENMNYLGGFK
jgi:hypothetical protein